MKPTWVELSGIDDGDEAGLAHLLVGGECDQASGVGEVASPDGRLRVDSVQHLAGFHIPQPEETTTFKISSNRLFRYLMRVLLNLAYLISH